MSKSVFTESVSRSGESLIKMVLGLTMAVAIVLAMAESSLAAGPRYAGIVIDARTGNVLYSEDADSLRYPASLTKMMTLYLTFEALEAGRIKLDTRVPVSAKAASEPPSKLGVRAGNSFTVEQGILALVTRSANDAATALGEYIGGSEARFATMMTNKARALGMTRTTYRNANGLPNTAQMTTARDQARLGVALRQHFPQYYGYFSTRNFRYGNQTIGNHNRLLGVVRGVDGIKTGYTRAAGFNLVTSAQYDGRSVVGVVLGATSGGARNARMKQLVDSYLPKASRNGKNNIISEPGADTTVTDEIAAVTPAARAAGAGNGLNLPVNGPLPDARYENRPVETAYAAPAKRSKGAAAAAQAVTETADEDFAAVAVPEPAPQHAAATAESASAALDKVTTASTASASGWVIQIGVSPDKKTAMNLLQSAQDKGGNVLRSATPFAVAFNNGSAEIYRARFGGFDDQKSAVNACKLLKRKGINCWASVQ